MNTVSEDNFVRKLVKTASVEKPGVDFSSVVMSRIEKLNTEKNKPLVASPLISTTGWVIISVIIVTVFAILFTLGPTTTSFYQQENITQYINSINFSIPIEIPGIFIYGVFGFVFFFIIEISLITNKVIKAK